MATLYTHKSENINKTWVLVTVFLVLVLGIGYILARVYGNADILLIAIIFSIVMNIASYWYSDKIALSMARAEKADENEYKELHNIVENLAITAGLPKPSVWIIPDTAPNAFATGRDAKHASIAVTSGLLAVLDRAELEGVVAHEMSHIGNNDILLQSMVVVLVGFISIVAHIVTRSFFWGGMRSRDDRDSGGVLVIVGIIFIIISPIIATLIQLAISRKREFLADASGALLTRYPEGLASALQKIHDYSAPMNTANTATAHMYISSPFGSKQIGQKISNLFATHPPVAARIKALTDMHV